MKLASPLWFFRCCVMALTMSHLTAAEQLPAYYWSGDQKVTVDLALDEVIVIADDHALPQEKARGLVQALPTHGQKSLVQMNAKQRDALIRNAQQLAKQPGVKSVRAALYAPKQPRSNEHMGVLTTQLAVRFTPAQDQAAILKRYQLEVVEKVSYSSNTVICSTGNGEILAALDIANLLYEQEHVVFATPLIERQLQRRGDSTDPLFSQQWHLKNTGQAGGTSGNDLNVTPVWNFAAGTGLGTGVNVAVVDDSLQVTHPDLSSNVRTDIDIDINGGDADPSPVRIDEIHGTEVGGVIAARGNNGIGGSGVAPGAKLVGIRLISAATTDAQDAQAMTHQLNPASALDQIHVSNSSWGPDDFGSTLGIPGPLMLAGLESGVTNGRGGKGIIYTWSAGNGLAYSDVSNFDGYAGSRFVIAVGAIAPNGEQALYSESGTNILITAPGGQGNYDSVDDGIVTTDRTGSPGSSKTSGDYTALTDNLAGTSFSAPAVAGVVALMLEANPALTWRDVRHALVRTATQNHSTDADWVTNGARRKFNLKYGYGTANAADAVAAVAPATWVQVPPQATPITISDAVSVAIPDNDMTGISRSKTLSAPSGFKTEYVELKLSLTHAFRGEVHFQLTSPTGMVSDFQRRPSDNAANYSNVVLTSVAHWGENPTGNWTLRAIDEVADDAGTLTAWSVTVYGYVPHALPTLTSVYPSAFAAGAGPTTMVVTGFNFAQGSTKVRWNDDELTTTVISSNEAQVTVPAGKIASVGTATVTVANDGFDVGEATLISGSKSVSVISPPVITAIPTTPVITNEDVAISVSVTADDTDTAANALIFSAESNNQSLVSNINCKFSNTGFTRVLTVTPNPDASGSATITVKVSDGVGSDSETSSFVVTSINDPPVALGGRFQVRAGSLLSGTVTGYDPEGSSLSFLNVTDPPGGGTFTFQPSSGQFTFTRAQTGMTSFTYTVFDGVTVSDPAVAYITVTGDPNGIRPLIISEPSHEVLEVGEGFNYGVIASFSRYTVAPISSNIAYSLVGAPTDMAISSTGVVTWSASGVNRHVSFGIQVRDTLTGALDTQQIMLRIVDVSAPN
jgi:subtilisin-like proprotein convertase family protein